ncbi:hypothetical protein [Methylocapsa sp. S129]|uniref:hypothetical protein n=1 Tax=Methylocapsa sp. S129 TaxID=1641869 RepID=UPI00131DAAD3|nr:hypothetical protein [Methylocapsa sp. S129]
MNIRSNQLFSRPRIAALALAVSLLSMGATGAHAQWLSWDSALSPMQVERMIQASGYRLTGPVLRNGPVYLANVLGREDDRERLVIDARDGRLLQRYASVAPRDWSNPPRPQASMFDRFFDGQDDAPPPRPPAYVYSDAGAGTLRIPAAPQIQAAPGGQVARADQGASPSDPYVILAPPAAGHAPALEKPKPKPQVKRTKPEPTPVAQPAANPQVPANPQAEISPAAATPATAHVAMPARPATTSHPAPSAPRVADTKAVAAPTPEIVPAAPAPAAPVVASAPQPAAAPPKRALNDVPVAPLE